RRAHSKAPAAKSDHMQANVAINHVNHPVLIKNNIVALRRWPVTHRLRNEVADLAWARWTRDVDNAKTAAEPHRKHQRADDAFVKLVRAETRAWRARKR